MCRHLTQAALLAALSVAMSAAIAQHKTVSPTELEQALREAASTINATLPRMLDDETLFTSVTAGDRKFRYNFTFVNYAASQVDPRVLHARQLQNRTRQVCNEEPMKAFIEMGITVAYAYHGNDNRQITVVAVTPAMCAKAARRATT